MNIGSNDRDHPISSPVNTPSPRHSPMPPDRQDSLDYGGYRVSPSHSPILSPQCLERPFDERTHNRRPSDEASMILRKISSGGNSGISPFSTFGNSFGNSLGVNILENKTRSLPQEFMRNSSGFQSGGAMGMENSPFQDFTDFTRMNQQQTTLGLGDTGRMLTAAFSDSYLPSVGLPMPNISISGTGMDDQRMLSPEDTLLPPITGQARHPSAPHLTSILTSTSLERSLNDSMTTADEEIPMRKRSWSMPANAHLQIMAPQISISSPDDPLNSLMFIDRPPETIGESSLGGNTFGDQLGRNLEISKCLQETQIPVDPTTWTEDHVRCWVEWAVKQFNLTSVDPQKFVGVNGQLLCAFGPYQFVERAYIKEHANRLNEFLERIKAITPHRPAFPTDPLFPQDFDYTLGPMMSNEQLTSPPQGSAPAITIQGTLSSAHNFIPTTSQAMSANGALLFPPPPPYRPNSPALSDRSTPYSSPVNSPMPSPGASPFYSPNASPCPSPSPPMRPHNPSGSGPIQLWQFLLELLTDRDCQNCIAWTGREWEFKLIDPEEVARRWGSRKNKPKMNYEKLSRGLRYYYDKNIIHKVPGKRYVYRFVCDLESMLGMSFTELQHQLKGEPSDRPIRIERQNYPTQNLLTTAGNFGADIQNLTLNPASPIPSPLSSPYSISPGLSGSPGTQYGAYLPNFHN